jgi:CRISPR-associated protein (Cas_Csy2)
MILFSVQNLVASRVNLLMNDFCAGLPSPLSFLGLGAAIAPTLGAERWSVGVLPVLHRVHVSEGRTKPEASPARRPDVFAPIEIPEDLVGSVTVSLLMDIPNCDDEHVVAEALAGKRIAGGPIQNEYVEVMSVPADGAAFKSISRGYAMIRTEEQVSSITATGAIDGLSAVAEQLFLNREPGSGWRVPVAVGHRLLENPATAPKRRNTRDPDIPHVFAEPVVGIAELVSVRNRRLTGVNADLLPDLFWRWRAEGDWITGHRNYHPDA